MTEPSFLSLVPIVWEKAELVERRTPRCGKKAPAGDRYRCLEAVVRGLLGGPDLRGGRGNKLAGRTYDESLVPRVELSASPASLHELDALKAQLDAAGGESGKAGRDRSSAGYLRIQAGERGGSETRDWSEARPQDDHRRRAAPAGWELDHEDDTEYG